MIYDSFSITVAVMLEDLGFCAKGEVGQFIEDGHLAFDQPGLTLNTDGGGLSSNHPGMRGLFLLLESVPPAPRRVQQPGRRSQARRRPRQREDSSEAPTPAAPSSSPPTNRKSSLPSLPRQSRCVRQPCLRRGEMPATSAGMTGIT